MDRPIAAARWTRPRVVALVLSLVVLAGAVYALTRSRQPSLRTDPERILVSTVERGEFQEFIPVSGTVIPIDNVFLDAVEGGRVEELFTEAGSLIQQGDQILRLTNTDLLLDIMWREAELFQQSNNLRNTRLLMEQSRLQLRREMAEIENRLRQQERTYRRYLELARHELIPTLEVELARDEHEHLVKQRELTEESMQHDLEFRRAQVEALEASLQRMSDNLEIVKRKQDNLTIRAPADGQLTALNAEVGQLKVSGERLGQIDILSGFKLRAAVDEHYVAQIASGHTGRGELEGVPFGVIVEKVYPEVQAGRFDVDLAFDGPGPERIRRGQRLRVRLELGESTDATLLSRGAFFEVTGGAWAYVLDSEGRSAERRRVRLGRQNPEVFEVLEGLEVGEQVITSSYEGYGETERLILDRP